MIPVPDCGQSKPGFSTRRYPKAFYGRFAIMMLIVSAMALNLSAQTVSWSDTFQHDGIATSEQCFKWTAFLDQLRNKKFASVTFSSSLDEPAKTIHDAAAATELARLLSARQPGVVNVGDDQWIVTQCGGSSCGVASVALSWNGNTTQCDCADRYAIKPHTGGLQWGGFNSETCNGPSQSLMLKFSSGVSITADGPTTFCKGDKVTLTAEAQTCSPASFIWSNGLTTQSIDVTESGNYFVTVKNPDGSCTAVSETISVTVTNFSLTVEPSFTICEEGVRLKAVGESDAPSGPVVNKYCLFDPTGDCSVFTDICTDDYQKITEQTFSQGLGKSRPSKIAIKLYYLQAFGQTEFTFRLNGNWIKTELETDAPGSCLPPGQYPRTVTLSEEAYSAYWLPDADNILTVGILAVDGEVYFAGIVAEATTPGETYSWTPITGLLSDPTSADPWAKPASTTTYTVRYTDAYGCTATGEVIVDVKCVTVPCVEITRAAGPDCTASVLPSELYDGVIEEGMTFSASIPSPYAVGTHNITLTVTDDNGSRTCITVVKVVDETKPTITVADLEIPNAPGTCSAIKDLPAPVLADNCGVDIQTLTKDKTDNVFTGETIVTWTVQDIHGNTQTAQQKVTVVNAAPVISSVLASGTSVPVNKVLTLTTTYVDNNVTSATIDWGDYSGIETVLNPANVFEVSHAYDKSGSYSATLRLYDACGSTTYNYQSIVVTNQIGASVSGAGWFDSPPGAYLKNRRAAGKANFSFEASNPSNSNQPVGSVNFNFKAAKLKFKSTQLQWLVVDGQSAALKAYGKVDKTSGYEILISMVDVPKDTKENGKGKSKPQKKSDQIRVKVWDPSGSVIYDTQWNAADDAIATTPIGGGSIEVNNAKTSFSDSYESPVASSFGEESTSAYPNPFEDWMEIEYAASSKEDVVIQLLDLAGKVVYNEVFPVSEDGSYSLDIPENGSDQPGIYILTIKQGKKAKILRVVRN